MADFAKIDPIDIPAHEMTPREFALWQKCRELRMEILRLGGSLHPSVDDEPFSVYADRLHLGMEIVATAEGREVRQGQYVLMVQGRHTSQIINLGIAVERDAVKSLYPDAVPQFMAELMRKGLIHLVNYVYELKDQ